MNPRVRAIPRVLYHTVQMMGRGGYYPPRVRVLWVRVRCGKTQPAGYPYQTLVMEWPLSPGAAGQVAQEPVVNGSVDWVSI